MSNVLIHKDRFPGAIDTGDVNKVGPNAWLKEHGFQGGNDGDLLVRDVDESDGAAWQSPRAFTASTPSGLFTKSPLNPVLPNAVEVSLIMDVDQCDAWYRNQSDGKIYYAFSTDADNSIWTVGNGGVAISTTSTDLGGALFPYVFKVGSTYYMAAKMGGGDLYLFSSADKITWAFANGSAPILTHSATLTSPINTIFNPAIAVVGTTWHLLIEGKTSTSDFQTSYSSAAFSGAINFNTNLSSTSVLPTAYDGTIGTGNPFLLSVPDRNALLALYGDRSGTGSINVLRIATVLLSTDPRTPANWTLAPNFAIATPGVHLTDPALVFTTSVTKTWKVLLHYNYNQLTGYAASGQLAIDDFYDTVTDTNDVAVGSVGRMRANAGVIGTTTTPGASLENTAAATAGQQQFSPGSDLLGAGWATNSGGASQPVQTRWELRPVQGAAAPTFNLVLMGRINNSVWTDLVTLGSDGSMTLAGDSNLGNVFAGGVVRSGANKNVQSQGDMFLKQAGFLYWQGWTAMWALANGKWSLGPNNAASGIGIDATVDGVVSFRNSTHTADAQVAAASVRGNAVTVANLPATPVLGMLATVSDATVTTVGTIVVGGSTHKCLVWYDGTNWRIAVGT